jgi:hypothetical protein
MRQTSQKWHYTTHYRNRKIVTRYKQEGDELAAKKKWRDIHKMDRVQKQTYEGSRGKF